MTTHVNMHVAKTKLPKLLELVAAGEHVVICKAGTPVADLVRHEPRHVEFGGLREEVEYDDDTFTSADAEIAEMSYGDVGPAR